MDALSKIKADLDRAAQDVNRMLNSTTEKLKTAMTQAEVVKDKRAKIMKKACTMQLLTDGNVRLVFDNQEDAEKIFE